MLPKASSSTSSLRKVDVEGEGMHDLVEFAEEVTTEYVQRADVLITHTAVFSTLHGGSMNSVHSKEVTGYTVPGEAAPGMEGMHKFMEEKVTGDTGEEIILKKGTPALILYGDRTHLYVSRWLDWMKNRHRHVRRSLSDKTMKDLICLLFDGPPNPWLQLARVNAVCGRIHRI